MGLPKYQVGTEAEGAKFCFYRSNSNSASRLYNEISGPELPYNSFRKSPVPPVVCWIRVITELKMGKTKR
jgi:hypothetical protein